MKKTLVVGARGFLGHHFFQSILKKDPQAIGTHHQPSDGLHLLNLYNPIKDLERLPLKNVRYALIAGGISSPTKCEANPSETYAVNVDGIFTACQFFSACGIVPIFLSSGYVFDGEKGNYSEEDPYSPINIYGRCKVELEKKLLTFLPGRCLIVRVAKTFGLIPGDKTLLDEIANTLMAGREVYAAKDQIFSPIAIDDLIRGVEALQEQNRRGLYHLGGVAAISRYELSLLLARRLEIPEHLVKPIVLADLQASFLMPKRSDLCIAKFLSHTHLTFPSLAERIERIAEKSSSLKESILR